MRGTKGPSSYIYLIECLGPDRFYKIGYASHPQQRLKELQTGCPYELNIVLEFPGGFVKEQEIHEFYRHSLVRGEWYNLSPVSLALLQMQSLTEWAPFVNYILELALKEPNPQEAVQMLHDCFSSCVNITQELMDELEPLIVGGGS